MSNVDPGFLEQRAREATANVAAANRQLSARLEPFDSYWQAPDDVESGYSSFYAYYKANYIPHMPSDRQARILVISCGPGYLVNTLKKHGYEQVTGIDAEKIAHANNHELNCETAEAFPYLDGRREEYDVIIPEQELNHLTLEEQIDFLKLCHTAMKPGGKLVVYGLNGANPMVGSENLSHNIDHFNTFTEYSLGQTLELAGFSGIETYPLKLYVFWTNPLNYVGLAITSVYELYCKIMFKLYGKNVKILSKKLAAVANR
jgi:2-polyprenyl-3-methyl-5-hydroxy-6-metoxy-1,4-benzoquinol methylase